MIQTGMGTPSRSLHGEAVARRQVVERVAAGDQDEAALEDAEHAQRDHDGGDLQVGHEEAVDGADEHAAEDGHHPGATFTTMSGSPASRRPSAT